MRSMVELAQKNQTIEDEEEERTKGEKKRRCSRMIESDDDDEKEEKKKEKKKRACLAVTGVRREISMQTLQIGEEEDEEQIVVIDME